MLAPNERGDLALVPYYTVLDEWVTGLHIVNTSARTQVVVENYATTWQAGSIAAAIKAGGRNTYVDSGDVLKVSYFIRDNATGVEFGDNAVHLGGFLAQPALTNQQYSVLSGDLNGFDFPDLNGGVPRSSAGGGAIQRAGFQALRVRGALGDLPLGGGDES